MRTSITKKIYLAVATLACVAAVAPLTSYAGEENWKETEAQLKKDLRAKTAEAKINAIKGLEGEDHEKAGEFLFKYIYKERKTPVIAIAGAEVIGTYKNKDTRELLKKFALKSPASCVPLLTAYFAQSSPETKEVAMKWLYKSGVKSPVLSQIVTEVGKHPSQDADLLKKLTSLLADKSFHSVRRASAEALGNLGNIQAVPALIPYTNDLVIAKRAQDSLYILTGEQHKQDKASWNKWWEANKSSAQPSGITREEADQKREASDAEEEKEAAKNNNNESFYGIPITGKSILFILDRSGSMAANNKMDKMKEELKYMIQSINKERSFGFVLFPHDTYPGKGVSIADQSFKRRATSFVDRLEPAGSTPITEAMEYSFKRVIQKNNVDTIYLLTDGAPNKPAAEVRALIAGLNADYYVEIHTLSIGADSQFLKDVAADNNGKYRAVK